MLDQRFAIVPALETSQLKNGGFPPKHHLVVQIVSRTISQLEAVYELDVSDQERGNPSEIIQTRIELVDSVDNHDKLLARFLRGFCKQVGKRFAQFLHLAWNLLQAEAFRKLLPDARQQARCRHAGLTRTDESIEHFACARITQFANQLCKERCLAKTCMGANRTRS